MKIAVSYSKITDESAKDGDFSEVGWEDEDGREVDNVEEAVEFLQSEGVMEPSCSCPRVGVWYDTEGQMDMYTGETTIRSYHLKGFTPEQELKIYKKLFPQYASECKTRILDKI